MKKLVANNMCVTKSNANSVRGFRICVKETTVQYLITQCFLKVFLNN